MHTETVTSLHLTEILPWWEAREEGAMPAWLLPPLGYVAIDESGPCAAGWLTVFEGVSAGQIDWLIGRPGLAPERAREACQSVYVALEEAAREMGLRMLFASACRPAMGREARGCGFSITSRDVIHLAKAI